MKDSYYKYDPYRIEYALAAADVAWWEMEMPSGAIFFSSKKTEMLGYEKAEFFHYSHFTSLLHPDDYDETMRVMADHMAGKRSDYETIYRIKAKDGQYLTFYDKGKIVKKDGDEMKIVGIVMKVTDDLREKLLNSR